MYTIHYAKSAEKYFKKLIDKNLLKSYKSAIEKISINPYIGTAKVGDLRGLYGYDVRYAGTNYELAYKIYGEPDNLVIIILAGTRENFYHELKRLI